MTSEIEALLTEVGIAAALIIGLLLAIEVGFRHGRRGLKEGEARAAGQVGAVQGATLGLLGLLLGFSFAGAATRFIEKQDLIVKEANAIGTAYLRADIMPEPYATDLRAALKNYTEHRIEVSSRLRFGLRPGDLEEVERLHARIWAAAAGAVLAAPGMSQAMLNPVNEVIDMHATRLATGRKHIPSLVLGLLIGCSALALMAIGHGCGLANRRFAALTVPLALLIAVTLWTIIDLDYPRAGLMRLSEAPLMALKFDSTP
ncbi:MAG: hypothetical protein ACK4WH_09090 [Phycisphaerales bacterium]